jgi:hypothetical protein
MGCTNGAMIAAFASRAVQPQAARTMKISDARTAKPAALRFDTHGMSLLAGGVCEGVGEAGR